MIKKLDCKQRKLNVNKKDEIQTKNKMLRTKTEKVANKIYHRQNIAHCAKQVTAN